MRNRTALPLCALLTSTALATLLIVQTTLACTDKVAMPMMPGMDMSSMSDAPGAPMLMVCPVVLALIALSLVLTAAAIALLICDPHRGPALRAIVRSLAGLPPLRTAGVVALSSASAVAAMIRLDGMGPSGLLTCLMVFGLLVVCSLSAAFLAIVAGRVALALSRRLILAIVAAVAHVAGAVAPRARRFQRAVAVACAGPLLARGRGLRAPPSFVH